MSGRRRLFLASLIALALGAGGPSTAGASVVTVGGPLRGEFLSAVFGAPATLVPYPIGAPEATATSPVTGAIVRWRIGGAAGGPFRLRVLTPNAGGTFTATGTSGPATPTSTGLQVFPASVPIKAGQVIGINNTQAGDELGAVLASGSGYRKWEPQIADGQTLAPTFSLEGAEFALNADVQPQPVVNLVGPISGSLAGGSTVKIAGSDFAGVKAVEFGSVPASSFTVNSEGLITAVAPAVKGPGAVDVSVTTVAGKSAPGAEFSYEACLVPKLKGKKLKAVRKALPKQGCKLGKATKAKGAGPNAKVKKQSQKVGAVLPPGAKVNVTLG